MAQRLQEIRKGLDAILAVYKDDSIYLDAIHVAHQMLDRLENLSSEKNKAVILFALEKFVHGWKTSTAQRLQEIRKSLSALLAADEGQPKALHVAYEALEHLETLAPEQIDIQLLEALEELVQDQDAPLLDIPAEEIILQGDGLAYIHKFERYGDLDDLERAIESLQRVVDSTPESRSTLPTHLSNLGGALLTRFEQVGSVEDLEAGLSHLQKAVNLTPDEHPSKSGYLGGLGNALQLRFDQHGSLEDLEGAVLVNRSAVELAPDGHPGKPVYLTNLGNALEIRYDRRGSLTDLEEAILVKRKSVELTPDGHPDKPKFLSNLGNALEIRYNRQDSLTGLEEAIVVTRKAVELTPDDHPEKPGFLNILGDALQKRFHRRGLPADLEAAILVQRKAVDLTPDGHPYKPSYLNNLGNISQIKFHREKALPDLEDAVVHRQNALRLMTDGHPDRSPCLANLSQVLRLRFAHLGDRNDLRNALLYAQESAGSSSVSSLLPLASAISWAECCILESTSSLPAYECAIKLLPRIAWSGLAVSDQYYLLAKIGSTVRAAVEAAIAEGEERTAIEWAEQGRSVVWQNLLSLRTPLDGLQSLYPELALRLQDLSRRLEKSLEARNALDGPYLSGVADNQSGLALERDRVIDEIQSKHGFEGFMKPKSVEELAPAARDGPVVFLNLGEARCDALALLSSENGTPRVLSIVLERVTLESAEQLSKKLVNLLSSANVRSRDIRKHKVYGVSDDKNAFFKDILRTLWLDYVRPVLDSLAYRVNIDSPPRLWWCTTGPLAFLPLHAAGLYDVEEAGHKVSDYVTSSYTPTLTTLLDKASPVASKEPKMLTVAISNTPGAPLPCTIEETRTLQQLSTNLPVVSLMNEKAIQKRVLEGLEESTWAHLACHGEQVGGKPMESGLILHDGKLKLSEIVKARLPNAEFAFLSACQTAVGDGGVPEESAHLAAGMLFAGYRGVVATMWSIQDDIAPRVAKDFYRYLFRHGQPKREEAAYALHKAVRSLQESGVPFTSWVPFIHTGR